MSIRGQSSQQIAETLRQDICLVRSDADGVLHEGALAQRFGVSRTPIRQALQRLAYERMITVKSGVGSVISSLEPSRRAEDMAAAVALLEAVAKCAPLHPATPEQLRSFAALMGLVEINDLTEAEDFFDLRSRLLGALAALIDNPILEDAFRAAYWRLIRWRLQALTENPNPEGELLKGIVKSTVQALKTQSIAQAFGQLALREGNAGSPTTALARQG